MYRLDGRLIAMGVLDLLPQAVSGVYFLYHSDFEKWALGKLSALREAALAVEGGYVYYYMGYYIHSCAKMAYKGDYKPYVLDFDTMEWHLLDDEMRGLMGKRAWVSMAREERIRALLKQTSDEEVTEETLASKIYTTPHPSPISAARTGLSVLELEVPGTISLTQLRAEVELEKIQVAISRGTLHEARDLVGWEEGGEMDMGSLRGVFAEFAACVGPEVVRGVVVDLSRGVAGG